MPLNVFGRRKANEVVDEKIDVGETSDIIGRGVMLLEELTDAVSRMDCLVKQCNIAWSVENGSYLRGSSRKVPTSTSTASPTKRSPCMVMPVDTSDEVEMVELLRRISEIVVQGEQQSNHEPESENIFHYFYHQNVLGKIVDILTGVSFLPDDDSDWTMLPPLSIATQAVQSVAIIILNVTKDTSLYLLLANERLNDLIDLPFDKYSSCTQNSDGELNELSTNFVSFLKSLTIRINTATLQFFLSFPGERDDETTSNSSHFSTKDKTLPSIPQVSFPLYTRALQFCTADQETFVRTTAMNICLNILRLASLPSSSLSDDNDSNMSLTLRDRIIISAHVCSQEKVLALITPISSKIVQLCGWLEDSISSIESFAGYSGMPQLRRKIRDIVLDLEEEFVLLDDVLKVGISSLNEKAIEILMATAIYPVLLQPLLYQKTRQKSSGVSEEYDEFNPSYKSEMSQNPFNSNEISFSLISSGLLGDLNKSWTENQTILSVPAKASLVCLVALLDSVTHPVLVRIVICCLFHPLAAKSSNEDVAVPAPSAFIQSTDEVVIKLDSMVNEADYLYDFGRRTSAKDKVKFPDLSSCIYVLTPAIADLLDRNFSRINVHANAYRNVIMSGLYGLYKDEGVQHFFVLLLHLSITSFGKHFDQIAFMDEKEIVPLCINIHSDDDENDSFKSFDTFLSVIESRESSAAPIFALERLKLYSNTFTHTIEALCQCVITAPIVIGGVWKLFFDDVACHSLLQLSERSYAIRGYASSILKQRLQVSAVYIDNISQCYINDSGFALHSSLDQDEIVDYFIDRIISEELDETGTLLDFTTYRVDNGSPTFLIPITNNAAIDRVVKLVLGDFFIPKELAESFEGDGRALICIITSFLSLMQLDALLYLLDPKGDYCEEAENKNMEINSLLRDINSREQRYFFLSPTCCQVLHHERGSVDPASPHKEETIVSFVGKTALPCVCEVTDNGMKAFNGVASFIETNGVRWQSLYMVLLSNLMVLVIPTKSSKGNGRIVTSCRLSGLSTEIDETPIDVDSASNPARRIILTFDSLDQDLPGLFSKIPSPQGQTLYHSYLELWFEKKSLADFAFDSLNKAICKAKSRRGKKIRSFLTRWASA